MFAFHNVSEACSAHKEKRRSVMEMEWTVGSPMANAHWLQRHIECINSRFFVFIHRSGNCSSRQASIVLLAVVLHLGT